MSNAEWIIDRPPVEADGDHIGAVHVKMHPRGGSFCRICWSYVAAGAPWQHTSHWQPPAEPARIAAMVKRLEELEGVAELPGGLPDLELRVAELERGEDAVGLLYSHLQSRLAKLEGAQDDGSAPKWTLDRIAALEQQVAALEAQLCPSAELPEDISYQQLKVEQMRTSAALLIAHANLIEAQP
jgi:hypothetical protein